MTNLLEREAITLSAQKPVLVESIADAAAEVVGQVALWQILRLQHCLWPHRDRLPLALPQPCTPISKQPFSNLQRIIGVHDTCLLFFIAVRLWKLWVHGSLIHQNISRICDTGRKTSKRGSCRTLDRQMLEIFTANVQGSRTRGLAIRALQRCAHHQAGTWGRRRGSPPCCAPC